MRHKGIEIWNRIGKDIQDYKWVILIFIIYDVLVHRLTGAFCPSVILTGFPCPGCGMTRAALFMMTGQFARAMRANPAILLWIGLGIYFVSQRYIRGRKVKYFDLLLGGVAAIMIVIFVYRMITLFPNQPPMTVSQSNLLSQIFPAYREFLRRF